MIEIPIPIIIIFGFIITFYISILNLQEIILNYQEEYTLQKYSQANTDLDSETDSEFDFDAYILQQHMKCNYG